MMAALLRSLAGQRSDRGALPAALLQRSWPGGPADRHEPVAVEWLRRWRPARRAAAVPVCTCREGCCLVCN